jgi:predicted nucleic acid-binding protein
MNIFIDTDVILDFLLDRKPFSDNIGQLFQLSIDTDLQICVSPTTITNINYIIGRMENKKQADLKTKKILKLVKVENVCQSTVNNAINSKFKDFEDAVQNFCAVESNHKLIITRNTKDYKESELAIFTPTEYLAQHKT